MGGTVTEPTQVAQHTRVTGQPGVNYIKKIKDGTITQGELFQAVKKHQDNRRAMRDIFFARLIENGRLNLWNHGDASLFQWFIGFRGSQIDGDVYHETLAKAKSLGLIELSKPLKEYSYDEAKRVSFPPKGINSWIKFRARISTQFSGYGGDALPPDYEHFRPAPGDGETSAELHSRIRTDRAGTAEWRVLAAVQAAQRDNGKIWTLIENRLSNPRSFSVHDAGDAAIIQWLSGVRGHGITGIDGDFGDKSVAALKTQASKAGISITYVNGDPYISHELVKLLKTQSKRDLGVFGPSSQVVSPPLPPIQPRQPAGGPSDVPTVAPRETPEAVRTPAAGGSPVVQRTSAPGGRTAEDVRLQREIRRISDELNAWRLVDSTDSSTWPADILGKTGSEVEAIKPERIRRLEEELRRAKEAAGHVR